IFVREAVDRPDLAFPQRDADKHRNYRLRHRLGMESLLRLAVVLVSLDENAISLKNEQAHHPPAGEEAAHVTMLPARHVVAVRRLGGCALELVNWAAARDPPCGICLVEVTEEPDKAAIRADVRIVEPTDRITLGLAEKRFVGRTARGS